MTLLDAVEEYTARTSSEQGKPEPGAHQKSSQALNMVRTGAIQSLNERPAVVRAEGVRWVNLSSSQIPLARLGIPDEQRVQGYGECSCESR